ncbi:hypothetical protein [Pelotomaculum propionicicum]|uniref:Superoxide reductase n=1 Tax=Pelotomaculum propionicicum TaxID=258475 RepID=A0A4Y7RIU4_9FIRM|nr:hypothetical protein [Pelotomaculum propionicicum]NLI13470.1 hypothetical protein [Peptococcaceae bacterium]TEB08726.1 hypothetical protein Pmgp_03663 [Pelotomaculum propionicicum]
MAEQEFGPLRSREARKPWPECPDIVIYRCGHCGRLYQGLGYSMPAQAPACCGSPMEQLKPLRLEDVSPEITVDYQIVGGYNQNAVQVFWEAKQPEDSPEWILLKTFTGSYIKYVTAKKRPPVVFALADEDAYVYCDNSPCLQCIFRCKRGFMIYLYIKTKGLLEIPLEKMSSYWQS